MKSGAAAGVIYGIIFSIIAIVYTYTQLEPGEYIVYERAIGFIIAYAIVGVIFGMIYAAAYSHLPGAKSISKGISIGVIWWIVIGLGLGYYLGTIESMPIHAVTSLISALIWGVLVGFFWDRYKA